MICLLIILVNINIFRDEFAHGMFVPLVCKDFDKAKIIANISYAEFLSISPSKKW
jgi:hypothetical protein